MNNFLDNKRLKNLAKTYKIPFRIVAQIASGLVKQGFQGENLIYNLINQLQYKSNLNNLNVKEKLVDITTKISPLSDNSTTSLSGKVEVYFRDLENYLIEHIEKADAIVGCIAWLTNERILLALSMKNNVGLVVQKEDFLRPDIYNASEDEDSFKKRLRRNYDALKGADKYFWGGWLSILSRADYVDPVRCMGNYNVYKDPSFPRMHNKFLVFCCLREIECDDLDDEGELLRNTFIGGR